MGSFIAIDNTEKSQDCPLSSNNPVVLDNRRSDNQDLTVCINFNMLKLMCIKYYFNHEKDS